MTEEGFPYKFSELEIRSLVLLLSKEKELDSELKHLYDTLLSFLYDSMTIEEAEKFFNES